MDKRFTSVKIYHLIASCLSKMLFTNHHNFVDKKFILVIWAYDYVLEMVKKRNDGIISKLGVSCIKYFNSQKACYTYNLFGLNDSYKCTCLVRKIYNNELLINVECEQYFSFIAVEDKFINIQKQYRNEGRDGQPDQRLLTVTENVWRDG